MRSPIGSCGSVRQIFPRGVSRTAHRGAHVRRSCRKNPFPARGGIRTLANDHARRRTATRALTEREELTMRKRIPVVVLRSRHEVILVSTSLPGARRAAGTGRS
ncbi:hypothetical protein Mro03_19520 [Microbispora rosea subsp. rosea]|nr:hypothetical protein Mro03_19520 [Microbispora rosea subsp. rosea]